jgi:hypothetical protein
MAKQRKEKKRKEKKRKEKTNAPAFTQAQNDLLFGTLLGDGYAGTNSEGKTWLYQAKQKAKDREYVDHKYAIIKDFVGTEPKERSNYDNRTLKTYYSRSFSTLTYPQLSLFGHMFYSYKEDTENWVKDVPAEQEIEKYLTPRALAFWYMDDGCLHHRGKSNGMKICTESFSEKGVERLRNVLLSKYGIATTKQKTKIKSGIGFRIYIRAGSTDVFRDLIREHLVPCMKCRVSDGNKGTL